ncbi:MAG: hypothetical protein HY748_03990 [Elusimicrobia bacterium]|nr:hypothetical protein [Elusimicrobiota bacterium]
MAEVAAAKRNRFMARRLAAKLGPGQKAVVLAGYGHLGHPKGLGPERIFGVPWGKYGNLARELAGAALRAFSITFAGGLFMDPASVFADRALKSKEHALLRGILGLERPAFVRTAADAGILRLGPEPGPSWAPGMVLAWHDGLSGLDSTREHAAFLKDHGIAFHVGPGKARGSERWVAQYENGNVYFNQDVLDADLESLIENGASPEEAARVVALKTLPYAAHKIRHAMTARDVREALGMPMEMPVLEDEILSHTDQVRLAALREDWGRERWQAWRKGWNAKHSKRRRLPEPSDDVPGVF